MQTPSHSMKRKIKISQHHSSQQAAAVVWVQHDQITLSHCGPLIDSVLAHTAEKMKSFFLSSFLDHSILVQSLVKILYDTCACAAAGSVYIYFCKPCTSCRFRFCSLVLLHVLREERVNYYHIWAGLDYEDARTYTRTLAPCR